MAAEDAKTDFSVVQGLFGINPEQLAFAREQQMRQLARTEAERRAQLTPEQLMGANMFEGASNAGRAMAPQVQGMFGMQPQQDPQMKFAQTMKGIMDELQQSGADMTDPVATQAEVGKRLLAAGFPGQGMQAIENARLQGQQRQAATADAEEKKAQAMAHYAKAAKDLSDRDPVAMAAAAGHIPVSAWSAYLASGKDPSVIPDTPDYIKVEMGDGVYLVNKKNPEDKIRLGELTPAQNKTTLNKPPPGYMWSDAEQTKVAPIPGGPADVKHAEARAKDTSSLSDILDSLSNLQETASSLATHKGVSGITGPIYGKLPGYLSDESANALAIYKNLQPEVAFGKLQSMREASKSGGALGQVSNQEENMLTNSIVALDRSQTTEQFKEQLTRLNANIERAKKRLQEAYDQKYGSGRGNEAGPTGGADSQTLLSEARAAKKSGKMMEWWASKTPAEKAAYNALFNKGQ